MHPPSLKTLQAQRWQRRLLRFAAWIGFVVYVAIALLVLAMRYAVLPHIDDYRGNIERAVSESLGRPVSIGAIDGHWTGLRPTLRIHRIAIQDAEGRTALALNEVDADIGWSSLWHLEPHFARLEIAAPSLDLRRDTRGHFFVAGLEIDPNAPSGGFADWLLAQDRIVIRDATITWHDEMRGAPPLALSHVNFDFRNSGIRHRFGLTAEPPANLATRLDLRGDFRGYNVADLSSWRGSIFAQFGYTDLAGWHAWIDYPLELPRGTGGLRLWVGFVGRALASVTADVRLTNVAVRLGKGLPMLELERADGRLSGKRLTNGYVIQTHHLAVVAKNGVRFGPTDLDLEWRSTGGNGSANGLDLGALVAMSAYLPLEPTLRERLLAYAPRGRVDNLRLSWVGNADYLTNFTLQADFHDLGLNAHSVMPGFSGLDGSINGNERGGTLVLASRNAKIQLPSVFQQATMTLATLNGHADWTVVDRAVEVRLERITFHNDDAAGEANGTYRTTGSGPGAIDLSARLTRASGNAVWRYMPLVVNQDTRNWLQRSLVGGNATATLRLKGDLSHFPFKDGSGIFEVKGPFAGVTLRYAPGWPEFKDVVGDLEFVGSRMVIRASQAKLWGVTLSDIKAEITDLDSHEEPLTVTGVARGPTADFLRYIEASPVGEHIDHFTQDMAASGDGELNLRLDLPLRHIADTRVDGRYRMSGDSLTYDKDMPPLTDVYGKLHFTGHGLTAHKIRANMLGAPMSLDVTTKNGQVAVAAAGTLSVRGLRQQYSQPLFDYLSGSAPWSGTIQVRKRSSDVRIQSSLKGISSSLPEPFNKTATDAMTLVFERRQLPAARGRHRPAGRDQVTLSLGDAVHMTLIRHAERAGSAVDQGVIAIGRPQPRLPEHGILLAVDAKRIDGDLWRSMMNGNGNDALPVTQVVLHADELRLFGRSFDGLRLTGARHADTWKFAFATRQTSGDLEWKGAGRGRLFAHLTKFALPENLSGSTDTLGTSSESMPAIELLIDRFLIHDRDLGELKGSAENKDGIWNTNFRLDNEDGQIEGSGRWRSEVTRPQTQVDLKLTAKSVEKMLGRFGYPGTVKRGTATLVGSLSWAGPPTAVSYAGLNGKFKLEAADGQFNKLEPGVARLLGIMSLQALPRRISLDFRDIFSKGFAFDSISGNFVVNHGIMDTKDLQIRGPAAKVLMNGSVNLVDETQDLKVRVQPALGESVATGALLVNPAVGAAAWALNKIFGNPIDKVFAFDYAVTGSWAEPKVEKIGVQGPSTEAKPGIPSS